MLCLPTANLYSLPPPPRRWLAYHASLKFSVAEFNTLVALSLPYLVAVGFLGLLVSSVTYMDLALTRGSVLGRGVRTLWAGLVCIAALGIFACSAVTLSSLAPDALHSLPPGVAHVYNKVVRQHRLPVASPYGLFRRMTGMGPTVPGQFGAPVPTVARPEVSEGPRVRPEDLRS